MVLSGARLCASAGGRAAAPRPPVAVMPDAQRHLADVDVFECEVFARELLRPARRPYEGRGRPLPTRCRIDPGSRPRADVDDRLAWP